MDEWPVEADAATIERAASPEERINGPVLVASGTGERIWSAEEACARIRSRLERAAFRHEFRHVSIEGSG